MFSERYSSHIQDFQELIEGPSGFPAPALPTFQFSEFQDFEIPQTICSKTVRDFHELFEVSWDENHWLLDLWTRPEIRKS